MEGVKANRYAALQGGGEGVKILSKSALRNGWTFPKVTVLIGDLFTVRLQATGLQHR